MREVYEETGVQVRNRQDPSSEKFSVDLQYPTAFAAVDSIVRDNDGKFQFHYAIIEVMVL